MKFARIILIIIPLYFFVGVLSAQDWSSTKYIRYTNRNLEVCSSGIRGNACDHTSRLGSDNDDRGLQSVPHDVRDKMLYMSYIESMIASNFVLPRGLYKDLYAVIVIKIMRNGNVSSNNFEKRSGNPNFDMSATKAINAATPFGPPPRELTGVEIRVTFHP